MAKKGTDLDARFRDVVRKLQQDRQISEKEVAIGCGISQQNLNRIMRGGGTSLVIVGRLCDWLNRDIASVLGRGGLTGSGATDTRKVLIGVARQATLEGRLRVAEWLQEFVKERVQ